MAGKMSSRHDFVAETNGLCFLCSNKAFSTSWGSESPGTSSSIYSLHCLSRYLKLDMRKVFTGNGPVPPDLMAKVEKAGLSVELCEECAVLIEKLSKQVRLLEKIEMEVSSGLELVRSKLESVLKLDKVGNFNDLTNEWMAKLEIANALRKDAMQKCSRNLDARRPLTKLEKLTRQQVAKEQLKLRKAAESKRSSAETAQSIYEDDDIGSPDMDLVTNEQGSDHHHHYQGYSNPSPSMPFTGEECGDMEAEDVKQEVIEETANNLKFEDSLERQQQSFSNIKGVDRLTDAVPPPIKVAGGRATETAGKPEAIGSFAMNRFICGECKKDFNYKHLYQRHYLNVHMGVKYKCKECGKTFSRKEHLLRHQNSVHLGKSFKCEYCSKAFSYPQNRDTHMKLSCPKRN